MSPTQPVGDPLPGMGELPAQAAASAPDGSERPFSVYLHDTPSQPLFAKGPRAFSSGCVRVEQPLQLRDLLLTSAEQARTDELLASGDTHEFRVAAPVPILLGYWTVQVDSDGTLLYAPDIYGRDPLLLKALGSSS